MSERRAPPPTELASGIPWSSLLSERIRAEPLERAQRISRTPRPPGTIEMGSQQPSPDLVPHEALADCVAHVLRTRGAAALGYSPDAGVPELRAAIAKDLSASGIPVAPEDVLVTSGSQQGIDLLARALVDPGDPFLVEEATYPGAIRLLAVTGAHVVGVPGDEEGPDLAALRRLARPRPKGLYLMPNYHNPLGTSISPARREGLVAWSRETGVPLVEDDYDADLSLDGVPPHRRLRALDPDVCHVGTYSKKLIPALRIGYLVCPPPVHARAVALKTDQDNGTSGLLQHALAECLSRGLLAPHLERILRAYRVRRDALEGALRSELPSGLAWRRPERGLFLWIPLPPEVSPEAVFEEGVRRGVHVVPSTVFSVTGRGTPGVRVTYCREPAERLVEGARRLGAAIRTVAG